MGALRRKLPAAVLTFAAAIAMVIALGSGATSASAEWGPGGTDAFLPGEDTSGLFDAPESADTAGPLGTYDDATGVYANPFFGLSYTFDSAWDAQGYAPDELGGALATLNQQGGMQDLMAVNMEAMQILYSMVLTNDTGDVIDEAFLEKNGSQLASLFMEFDSSMTVVESRTGTLSVANTSGSLEMPTITMQVVVDQDGQQIPVFVGMAFASGDGYVQMIAAITYTADTTADVLAEISPYGQGGAGLEQPGVLGTLSAETHRYQNAYFGVGQSVYGSWRLCGAGLEEEVAFAADALANYGAATDMVMQNTETGQVVAGLIIENYDGAAVDEEFAMDMGDYVFCAFLNASGLIMDPEFFDEDFSYLMAYANEVDPKILDAQSVDVVDATSLTGMAAGHTVPCIHADCTATCNDGALELPLYVTIAYIPQGNYIYALGAASYDSDTTLELLESFGADDQVAEPVDDPEGTEGAPAGSENDPAGTEGTGGTAGGEWTVQEVRYQFEHSMLRRYFYDDPANMLSYLADSDLYTLWNAVATDNGVPVTFTPEDYVEHWYTCSDGTLLLQIELPQPDDMTLCYRIYFLYNPQTGNAAYYTMEYDNFFDEACFACMWTADGTHNNYGTVDVLDKNDPGYADALVGEAQMVLELAGIPSEGLVEMAA